MQNRSSVIADKRADKVEECILSKDVDVKKPDIAKDTTVLEDGKKRDVFVCRVIHRKIRDRVAQAFKRAGEFRLNGRSRIAAVRRSIVVVRKCIRAARLYRDSGRKFCDAANQFVGFAVNLELVGLARE